MNTSPSKLADKEADNVAGKPFEDPEQESRPPKEDSPIMNPEADGSVEPSSELDSSRTGTGSSSSNDREDNAAPVFAKREHRNVVRSKVLVILVLLMAAILVSFFTYYFLSQEEQDDFESQVSRRTGCS